MDQREFLYFEEKTEEVKAKHLWYYKLLKKIKESATRKNKTPTSR